MTDPCRHHQVTLSRTAAIDLADQLNAATLAELGRQIDAAHDRATPDTDAAWAAIAAAVQQAYEIAAHAERPR